MSVFKCYEYGGIITQQNHHVLFHSISKLEDERKKAVWAVCSFQYALESINQTGKKTVKQELLLFENEYNLFKRNVIVESNPIWHALSEVCECFDMGETVFEEVIDGYRKNFLQSRYETVEGLLEFCYQTSGTLWMILFHVISSNIDDLLKRTAEKLGAAIHLSTILGNIGTDLMKGKIYLPKQSLRKYQYSINELIHRRVNDRFVLLWEELASIAEQYFAEVLAEISQCSDDCRVIINEIIFHYREKFNNIRKDQYKILLKRNFPPWSPKKLLTY